MKLGKSARSCITRLRQRLGGLDRLCGSLRRRFGCLCGSVRRRLGGLGGSLRRRFGGLGGSFIRRRSGLPLQSVGNTIDLCSKDLGRTKQRTFFTATAPSTLVVRSVTPAVGAVVRIFDTVPPFIPRINTENTRRASWRRRFREQIPIFGVSLRLADGGRRGFARFCCF